MTTITADVDIIIEDHLNDVETDILIEELGNRKLSVTEKRDLINLTCEKKTTQTSLYSLIEEIKLQVVLKGLQNKTLAELEQFFK
jgi:hypothetical protein